MFDMIFNVQNAENSNNFLWKILKFGIEGTVNPKVMTNLLSALVRFEKKSGKDTNDYLQFGSSGNIEYLDFLGDGSLLFIG